MNPLIKIGGMLLGVLAIGKLLNDEDEKGEQESPPDNVVPMEKTETETVPETVSQTVTVTENETVPETVEKQNNTVLRRGDRFICPKTGEQLQVRAVGGRPRKKTDEALKLFPWDDTADTPA